VVWLKWVPTYSTDRVSGKLWDQQSHPVGAVTLCVGVKRLHPEVGLSPESVSRRNVLLSRPQNISISSCLWIGTALKMTAFWNIAPCSHVGVGQRFRGAYCLHYQSDALWKFRCDYKTLHAALFQKAVVFILAAVRN
jgi:hypothetical protein